MIISEDLAQKIVNTIMDLLHRNVNIFNHDGIIIATGHPHRYHTFHKGAKDAIDTGTTIEIYADQLPRYPGALQGVNLPIVLDEQMIGAVGVFGNPDEVRYIGKLVKAITELILQYELLQKESRSRHSMRANFMDFITAETQMEIMHSKPSNWKRTIKGLGIRMDIPRAAILIDFQQLITNYAEGYGFSELLLERVESTTLKKLNDKNLLQEQDVALLQDGMLIILKALTAPLKPEELYQCGLKITQALPHQNPAPYLCGIGAPAKKDTDYHISYEQAHFCLQQCNIQNPIRTIYEHDMLTGYALQQIVSGPASPMLQNILSPLRIQLSANPEIQPTLHSLLNNKLNIKIKHTNSI